MTTEKRSRRDFLISGSIVFSASWVALNMPLVISACQAAEENMEAGIAFQNISAPEAVLLASVVDQIIPKDETPGASESGVVHFIDIALGGFMADAAPMLRQGLEDLDDRSKSVSPQESGFHGLSFEQQTGILKSIEDTPFFGTLHFMTVCGMFCLPEYGGNRDHAGWKLLGFDHQHAWQPPFGYYDAEVHGKATKGEKTNEHG